VKITFASATDRSHPIPEHSCGSRHPYPRKRARSAQCQSVEQRKVPRPLHSPISAADALGPSSLEWPIGWWTD